MCAGYILYTRLVGDAISLMHNCPHAKPCGLRFASCVLCCAFSEAYVKDSAVRQVCRRLQHAIWSAQAAVLKPNGFYANVTNVIVHSSYFHATLKWKCWILTVPILECRIQRKFIAQKFRKKFVTNNAIVI